MLSVTLFRYRFTTNWLMFLLALAGFTFFLKLGFWQLQRAAEKQTLLNTYHNRQKSAATNWESEDILPKNYSRINVSGFFYPQQLFLDNQHYQHQFGYNALSALALSNGYLVIIDRGWIAGDPSRVRFPKVTAPTQKVKLSGTVYWPTKQWILGPIIEKKSNTLYLLERFDNNILSQVLQKKVYPFIIRLDAESPYGFRRHWEVVSMPPQRHKAYALQWFVMASLVIILFIALNLKKKNEPNNY